MKFPLRRTVLMMLFPAAFAMAARAQPPTPGSASPIGVARDYASAKSLFDSWKAPVPPRKIVGNIYYVGAIGVSSYLITTPAGHFLIDTGFEDTVPIVQRGVEQLGFKLTDIKFLLSSHAHVDHTAGHARVKQLTGARIVASAADARVLESGGVDDFIPFPRELILYTPVKADRIVRDGETLTLGGVTLTAHLTPGHTKGATTWTMDVTENGRVRHVLFFSSASINSGTQLVKNPAYPNFVEEFTGTFAKLKTLPCDIWLAPHGGQFAMADKFERLERGVKPNPFIDPEGWQKTLAASEASFLKQLHAEQAATK